VPTSTIPRIFYRPDALPAAQPTVSKHSRQPDVLDKGPLNGLLCCCPETEMTKGRGVDGPCLATTG